MTPLSAWEREVSHVTRSLPLVYSMTERLKEEQGNRTPSNSQVEVGDLLLSK